MRLVMLLVLGVRGQGECADSLTWFKNLRPEQDCTWVHENAAKRCDAVGADRTLASYSCPAACRTPCGDSPTWFRHGNPSKDCSWVSIYSSKRCQSRSEWGEAAAEACPAACPHYVEGRQFESCDALLASRLEAMQEPNTTVTDGMAPREVVGVNGGECFTHYYEPGRGTAPPEFGGNFEADSGGDAEFSDTNAQETGVYEPDVVKATGNEYVFIASATRNDSSACEYRLSVVRDDDAGLELVASIPLVDLATTPIEMFVANDVLVIVGSAYLYYAEEVPVRGYYYSPNLEAAVVLLVFDVSDPTSPTLVRRQIREGYYIDGRRIENTSYVVITRYASWGRVPRSTVPFFRDEVFATTPHGPPEQKSSVGGDAEAASELAAAAGPTEPVAECSDVNYVWPLASEIGEFTSVVPLSMDSPADAAVSPASAAETIATRADATVYASRSHLYLTQVEYMGSYDASFIEWPTMYRTVVMRFSLDGLAVQFDKAFAVPGLIINQFAMSETSDAAYLRVATTTRPADGAWTNTSNALFVYSTKDGQLVGSVRGLAPGESIFSVRFVGDIRCYLVTFVQTDPLFVVSLDNPYDPKVLGELKIEGFSSYLHPLNATHLIGLGRNASLFNWPDDESDPVAIEQGLQLSLFDVVDDTDPQRDDVLVIGDRGSMSDALYDHKAFQLFEGDIVSIPALVASLEVAYELFNDTNIWQWGIPEYQGALLFQLQGSQLVPLANVSHLPDDFFTPTWIAYDDENPDDGYWNTWFDTYGSGYHVKRTLSRGDVFFVFSDTAVTKSTLDENATLIDRLELNEHSVIANLTWGIAT